MEYKLVLVMAVAAMIVGLAATTIASQAYAATSGNPHSNDPDDVKKTNPQGKSVGNPHDTDEGQTHGNPHGGI